MSNIESAIARLEEEQCTDPTCDGCQSRRTVIAAAREKEVAEGMTLAVHLAVKVLREQLAAERQAREQAEASNRTLNEMLDRVRAQREQAEAERDEARKHLRRMLARHPTYEEWQAAEGYLRDWDARWHGGER